MVTKPEGWRNKRPDDSKRHSDASRGIASGRFSKVKKPKYIPTFSVREIKGIKLPDGVEIPKNAKISIGEFSGGDKWLRVDKVIVNDVFFDTKTTYTWDDTDFPSNYYEVVEEAREAAKKDGWEGEDAWIDYLDYSKGSFSFKAKGFMIRENGVEILPDSSLGRIPVKELQNKKGHMIFE
jgi:hypothetical protein